MSQLPDLKKFIDMGFHETIVQIAYSKIEANYSDNLMIDTLYEVQAQNNKISELSEKNNTSKFQTAVDEDEAINKAILESFQTAKSGVIETANPIERQRKPGVPVGLKNIGNSLK